MTLKLRSRARVTLRKIRRTSQRLLPDRPTPPAVRIVAGLAFLVVIGTLLLLLPGVGTRRRLTVMEALFTSTSALSVTGLSIIIPSNDLTLFGQIILMLLIQAGGVGFMVIAVVSFRLLGRRIALLDRIALSDSLGLLNPGGIVTLTQRIFLTVVSIEMVGAVLLWLHWHESLGDSRAVLFAVFHAVSSFCNAGFDLYTGLPGYPDGPPNDNITLLILGSLIFMGGLGIPVLANLLAWPKERRISLHTRITLVVVVSLLCVGGFGLFFSEGQAGAILASASWPRRLLLAFFQSVSARTAGFAGIQPFDRLSPSGQFLLTILMFIGAAPASMGGGITTGTFAVLTVSIWSYARGLTAIQVGKRSISGLTLRRAVAVLTISLFLVLGASWLILMTHAVPVNVALFEVVSAFATCGLSLAFTSKLNLVGQLVIIFVMFWGRLGALTIVVVLAQQRPRQLVEFPEEQILIG